MVGQWLYSFLPDCAFSLCSSLRQRHAFLCRLQMSISLHCEIVNDKTKYFGLFLCISKFIYILTITINNFCTKMSRCCVRVSSYIQPMGWKTPNTFLKTYTLQKHLGKVQWEKQPQAHQAVELARLFNCIALVGYVRGTPTFLWDRDPLRAETHQTRF